VAALLAGRASERCSHRSTSVTASAYAAAVFCSWSSVALYAANKWARSGPDAKDQRAYASAARSSALTLVDVAVDQIVQQHRLESERSVRTFGSCLNA
jgi:hypothetical protein